jgi:4-amino-4-deoxy-L-arabinose transferase-like glycosyltransferase
MTLTEINAPVTADAANGTGNAAGRKYLSFTDDNPDWLARGSVLALLVAVGFLYLWGLSASGYANSFYSAAAQAGSQNWTAWFFGSLDGGNSITVDKPPAAIWLMALSVRLFGLSSWSILVPEALLGVASVGVLYVTVRRSLLNWRGQGTNPLTARNAHWAAMAGAAVFALTPVATLMFRFNNPDALLIFTMVLASYFTVRACEHAGRGWLALAGVALGFGFLTKMMQAFLVLPAFVVAYWFAAPAAWKKKLVDLLVALVTLIASFGWYIAVVELTPASMRPYIGGSQNNSLLELILSYNGLGRITGNETGSVGGGTSTGNWGTTSIGRMFEGVSGGMVSWLIPAALILGVGAILVAIRTWKKHQETSPRTQTPAQALIGGAIIWLGWLVVTGLVFSFMAGIYHDYYTVALAPAIGGAVAIGGAALWAYRGHPAARITLGVTSLGSGVWALVLLLQAGSWYAYLGWAAMALGALAGLAMIWLDQLPILLASSVLIAALGAGLIGPLAYSIDTAATAHTGSIVTAGPVTNTGNSMGGGQGGGPGGQDGGQGGQPPSQTGTQTQGQPPSQAGGTQAQGGPGGTGQGDDGGGNTGMGGLLNGSSAAAEVVTTLQTSGTDYTWVAATVGSQNAASYQLASGYSVMAIGGFNGSDPSPTLDQFKAYVAAGKIHYYIAGSVGQSSSGSNTASDIATWVAENFTATTIDSVTVYDLTQN